MMRILDLVNDIKDGQIKLKSEQAAYLEALKSARDEEAAKKEEGRKERLEEGKSMARRHNRKSNGNGGKAGKEDVVGLAKQGGSDGGGKKGKAKRVSFNV